MSESALLREGEGRVRPEEGGVPQEDEVVEAFSRIVDTHLQFHALLREEQQLRGHPKSNALKKCRLLRSTSNDQMQLQLQQLLQQLQQEGAPPEIYEQTLCSVEALAAAHPSLEGDATLLTTAAPGARRPLLALPLAMLGRLATAGVVTWPSVVLGLSSQPRMMKTLLQEVIAILMSLPEDSSPTLGESLGGVKPPKGEMLSPAGVDAASHLCLALAAAAYSPTDSSKPQQFAKKVLQVLTLRIVKFLLSTCPDHIQVSEKETAAAPAKAVASNTSNTTVSDAAVNVGAAQWKHCALIEFYDRLLEGGKQVGRQCVVELFKQHLHLALTAEATLPLSYVLQHQHLYRSSALHPLLRGMLLRVCAALGWEEALSLLDATLRRQEVCWGLALPCVSTLASLCQPAALAMQEMVLGYLRSGCSSEDQELCVLGLLLGRQCCGEGPQAFFPRYPHWFAATFGSSLSSPASNRREFVFLLQVLTSLVPHESALHLCTHTTQAMATPVGCGELLREYQLLARTRLRDFGGKAVSSVEVQDEVHSVVQQHQLSHQIPRTVLEMAVFKRNYFLKVFLPTLLSLRSRKGYEEFVDALSAAGHVPASIVSQYIGTTGEGGTDSSLPSTPVSVVEDLRLLLERLQTAAGRRHSASATDGRAGTEGVQRVLSDAAEVVEKLLRSDDLVSTHETAICEEKICSPHSTVCIQVMRLVLECVEATVRAKKNMRTQISEGTKGKLETRNTSMEMKGSPELAKGSVERPSWLPQLVALLAVSPSLQRVFLAHVLRLVTEGDSPAGPTSSTELRMLGIVACEVTLLEGLFMNVSSRGNVCEATPFHLHILKRTAPRTPTAAWAAARLLSNWLVWRQVCSTTESQPHRDNSEFLINNDLGDQNEADDNRGIMNDTNDTTDGPGNGKEDSNVMDGLRDLIQGSDEVIALYWCVLWRLEEHKHLLQPSLDIRGLGTATTSSQPSLLVWLHFELRCGGEQSYTSRCRSLQRLINKYFPAASTRTVIDAILRVLLDEPLGKQEDLLCLLTLLQQLAGRLTAPFPEGLLKFYSPGKNALYHERFVRLLQEVPPRIVVGGLSGSEVQGLMLPLLQDMKIHSSSTHLSSDFTSCLVNALLLVDSQPVVGDSALNHLWHSVAFHWTSVRWVFEETLGVSGQRTTAFSSLQELWDKLGTLSKDDPVHEDSLATEVTSSMPIELSVHFLLGESLRRLRLNAPAYHLVRLVSGLLRKMYVKSLASFVGEQIFCSQMIYFPSEQTDTSLALTFQKLLSKHCVDLFEEEMSEDIRYFLECISNTNLDNVIESYCLFGFVHVSLCCLQVEDSTSQTDIFKGHILRILIGCHCAFSRYFDQSNNFSDEEPRSKKPRLDMENPGDYLSRLYLHIVSHIRKTKQSCLALLLPVLPPQVDQGFKNLIERICSRNT